MEDTPKELWEEDILIAVATAQGVMTKAVVQIMARDKYDGIRAAGWLKKHAKVYHLIVEDFQSCCGGSEAAVKRADELAKEP